MLIRPSRHTDRAALYEICLLTGDDGKDASALYNDRDLLADIYLGPYLELEPQWCWTVDDDGTPQGYLVATPDTLAFERRADAEWWPAARARHPRDEERMSARDLAALPLLTPHRDAVEPWLASYPAHLHIDLLPATQGHGMGRALMQTLFEALREQAVPGVHLGVSRSNTSAIGFYTHLGFTELESHPMHLVLGKRIDLSASR